MMVNEQFLYLHVGWRIRQGRTEKKLSQVELADRVGLTRTSITNIECGEQRPPLHVLYTICMALELEPKDVLPTIAQATTGPERVGVMILGIHKRVSRDAAKTLLKLAESDEKKRS